jgi:CubicO group peptidase (beta-lactamase class C family)
MSFPVSSRRTLLANLLWAAAGTCIGGPALHALAPSQFGGGRRGGNGARQYLEAFRRQYRVPAMSVALSRNGQFVYDHAGGMANIEHAAQVSQNSLFRIADLSKPITAVAIFSLIEAGMLTLDHKVFGATGILGAQYSKIHYPASVADITVDHLLTHTAGGWAADDNDPMAHNHGWDQTKLIASTIERVPLTSQPGSQWAYSNFGYCVLGRVIEQVTGQSYEAYMQKNILAPCGITSMQIAHNSERQRASDEVIYTGQYSEDPYKLNVNRMDSTGGWIASATQLVQFLDHVAGAPGIPALLKAETIRLMTTPAPATPQGDARYARGWMVDDKGAGSWWHSGSLPGSTAFMIRNPDGSSSAALCNTRTQPHDEIDTALRETLEDMEGRIRS